MPGPHQKRQQCSCISCFPTREDPPPDTTFSSLVIFMNSLGKKYHFWHAGLAAEELFLFHLLHLLGLIATGDASGARPET
ncbi:hypothetical protein RLOC_00009805 [Lonchura striata]|uniref:Uncharacterized protein n=1 Tax=Lonchura striata TaxID=40157 RepID=A0A218VC69_9PASE|nr:hypothetical protein RLOC_00009805 [Lonchura striata domestica]